MISKFRIVSYLKEYGYRNNKTDILNDKLIFWRKFIKDEYFKQFGERNYEYNYKISINTDDAIILGFAYANGKAFSKTTDKFVKDIICDILKYNNRGTNQLANALISKNYDKYFSLLIDDWKDIVYKTDKIMNEGLEQYYY